jgi:hypothetical protein
MFVNKIDVTRRLLIKRGRVSLKLSSIANDIAANGRRHDNSYTDSTELNIIMKIENSDDEEEKKKYKEILKGIHENNNSYLPGYHDNDLSKMNMIQLIEFICHRVTEYDIKVIEEGAPSYIDNYIEFVCDGLNMTDDLRGVISETVRYVVEKNKTILKNLPKQSKEIAASEFNNCEVLN